MIGCAWANERIHTMCVYYSVFCIKNMCACVPACMCALMPMCVWHTLCCWLYILCMDGIVVVCICVRMGVSTPMSVWMHGIKCERVCVRMHAHV